jgi:hypothetical protein
MNYYSDDPIVKVVFSGKDEDVFNIKEYEQIVNSPRIDRYFEQFSSPTSSSFSTLAHGSVKRILKNVAIIISYEMCVSMIKNIINFPFNVVIADESHFFKNHSTKRCFLFYF